MMATKLNSRKPQPQTAAANRSRKPQPQTAAAKKA